MTIKELSQYYYLNREIDMLQRQLRGLREQRREFMVFDSVQTSGVHEPYQKHTKLISGIAKSAETEALSVLIRNRKYRITQTMIKCSKELARLEIYIESIPDSLTRQIFTLRFVEGCTWQRVANKVGGDNTADGVRKIATRYLQNS